MDVTGSTHVALEIWDIGGQTIGSTMLANYIFGAHVSILTTIILNLVSKFPFFVHVTVYTLLLQYLHSRKHTSNNCKRRKDTGTNSNNQECEKRSEVFGLIWQVVINKTYRLQNHFIVTNASKSTLQSCLEQFSNMYFELWL